MRGHMTPYLTASCLDWHEMKTVSKTTGCHQSHVLWSGSAAMYRCPYLSAKAWSTCLSVARQPLNSAEEVCCVLSTSPRSITDTRGCQSIGASVFRSGLGTFQKSGVLHGSASKPPLESGNALDFTYDSLGGSRYRTLITKIALDQTHVVFSTFFT
jgi:hypothetical protein